MTQKTTMQPRTEDHASAFRLAGLYLLFGAGWIVFSDSLLGLLPISARWAATIQLFKGWAYVALTALLAYGLVLRLLRSRTQALEELQASEQQVRKERDFAKYIMESSPIATMVMDRDGDVVFANSQSETVFGLSRTELHRRTFNAPEWRIADLEGQPIPDNALPFHIVKASNQPIRDLRYAITGADQKQTIISITAAPILTETDQFDGVIAAVEDISEKKKTESALRESEQKFRTLFETANDAIFLMRDGCFIDCNAQTLKMFRCVRDDIIGASPDLFSPTKQPDGALSSEKARAMIASALTEGPQFFEWEHLRRDGTCFPAEVSLNGLELGGETLLQAIVRDVADRKRTEDALRRSEEQFRLIMDNLVDLVAVLDLTGRRLYNSPSYAAILGDTHALKGTSSFMQIHPDDRDRVEQTFQATVRSGKGQRLEYRMLDQNGSPRHIESQGSVIRDAQGRVAQVVVVSRDVTERRRAEDAIRELNANLEQRVAERTEELALAKERAESADRLKSVFLAAMSHELRTPLNAIIGFTGILLQGLSGPLNQEQSKQLTIVQESARHLLALINDVLDLSKIEAGQLEVELAPFDIRESIEKAFRLTAPLAKKKGLTLSADISPTIASLTSDKRRCEQILINLIGNGIKFTEKGTVHVDCVQENEETVIRVTDTGMGIKPEDMGKLFHAFRQIDGGLARKHEGTGLGLAI